MGIKLERIKKRNWTLSILYKLSKLPFAGNKSKFKFFLDLEWIFDRLVHEKSFDVYTPDKHPLRLYSNKYILNLVKETDRVLDLGCHAGHITSVIAGKAKQVVGIDYDATMIESAKKMYKKENLLFINDEVSNYLNKNSETFDVLLLSHILEHLDDPKKIILECRPFINYIYIELPDFDKSYMNHYRRDMKCDLIYTDIDHITEFDRYEMKQLITECGFILIESEYRFGVQRHWCKKANE